MSWSLAGSGARGPVEPNPLINGPTIRLADVCCPSLEDARALTEHSSRWRPWRSYAAQHLWTALDHAVNQWPPKEK